MFPSNAVRVCGASFRNPDKKSIGISGLVLVVLVVLVLQGRRRREQFIFPQPESELRPTGSGSNPDTGQPGQRPETLSDFLVRTVRVLSNPDTEPCAGPLPHPSRSRIWRSLLNLKDLRRPACLPCVLEVQNA
jgi:hypothetical protein